MSRQALIKKYVIKDENLNQLLKDLLSKPDCDRNRKLIQNALRGVYSDFGSPLPLPLSTLEVELRGAGYDDLAKNVIHGHYDHSFGGKLKGAASPKHPASDFLPFFSSDKAKDVGVLETRHASYPRK